MQQPIWNCARPLIEHRERSNLGRYQNAEVESMKIRLQAHA